MTQVTEHGFKASAYKMYFKEQNTKNDFDMMISQEKNLKLFFEYLSRGSQTDIKNISFYIKHDPRQNLYPRGHPDLVVN